METETGPDGGGRVRIGLVAGPLFLAAALLLPAPEGMTEAAWRTAGTGLLMATWWVTEAIPIPATALLPLVLFPVLGIADIQATAYPYANDLIFLFLGGFLLAIGMDRWGLPRRIALRVVGAVGTRPGAVVAGFMASTAFLSMWVSNTATTLIMLPIGVSVLALLEDGEPGAGGDGESVAPRDAVAGGGGNPVPEGKHFAVTLMLGIAYAASIGGVATLIGTPPNAFLAGFLSESYGFEVGFAQWLAFGLPLAIVGLPVAWVLLTRVVYPIRLEEIPGGRSFVRREIRELGGLTTPERRVSWVFALVATLWVGRPLLDDWVPGLSDAGIAMTGGLVLFLLPAGAAPGREGEPGGSGDHRSGWVAEEGTGGGGSYRPLLSWEEAERLPWGVLVLFGGGLSLASAIQETGLTRWIGEATEGLAGMPLLALVAVPALVVVLLTELTSNTATAAAFLPVLASVAVGVGQDPLLLAVPAAVAASCAFMLPVATPPNAIVYGSGVLTVPLMARVGAILNLVFVALVTAAAYWLLPLVFGVEFGVVPGWVGG